MNVPFVCLLLLGSSRNQLWGRNVSGYLCFVQKDILRWRHHESVQSVAKWFRTVEPAIVWMSSRQWLHFIRVAFVIWYQRWTAKLDKFFLKVMWNWRNFHVNSSPPSEAVRWYLPVHTTYTFQEAASSESQRSCWKQTCQVNVRAG